MLITTAFHALFSARSLGRTLRWLPAALALMFLAVHPAHASSLLVLGNSLTQHGTAPELGWQGSWGMAASASEKDFVHLLSTKLEQTTTEKVSITISPAYPLEKNFLSDAPPTLAATGNGKYDYIVVELGDNIDFSSARADFFAPRYDTLLADLQKSLKPSGKIACLGKWWANEAVDALIRSSCERRGGNFVALSPIAALPTSHANSERSFSNKGVGEHPSDAGMAEIANRVYCALSRCTPSGTVGMGPDIGVFYFPGWYSQSRYWKDIKGLPESRSPNRPWPEREPLLGYYAEEDPKIAQQHIAWASQYGVTFFAYDWYWDGKGTYLSHAVDNFIKAPNNSKIKFSLLWANHSEVPRNLSEFDAMIDYWVANYFRHPQFYKIDSKPVIFIFSSSQLENDARKFGSTAHDLLTRADRIVKERGLPGLFLIATTNGRPDDKLENYLARQGYSAYSGWNYVAAKDSSPSADYASMVETYLDFYAAAQSTAGALSYVVPASPGWDSRPWQGAQALVRADPSPEKFSTMLAGACRLLRSGRRSIMNLVMIEAWNEFGEGAYIEPTKQWQFRYLETIQAELIKKCNPKK